MFILPWISPPTQDANHHQISLHVLRRIATGETLPRWNHPRWLGWIPTFQSKTPRSQLTTGTPKLVVWRCFSFSKEIFLRFKMLVFQGCIPSYTILPHPAKWKKNMASSKIVSRPASTFPTSFPAQEKEAFFMWPTKREQESKPGRYQTWCFVVYVFLNVPILGIYMWES